GGFPIPNAGGFPNGAPGDPLRRQVDAFMMAFDTNLAPIVGQQVTVTGADLGTVRQIGAQRLAITDTANNNPTKRRSAVRSLGSTILAPAPGSTGDPRCGSDPPGTVKAQITVSSRSTGKAQSANLPCQNWTTVGPTAAPIGYRYNDPTLAAGTVRTV